MNKKTPAFLHLHQKGELRFRVQKAREKLACCTLCPRACRVNRLNDEHGFCRTGRLAQVASYDLHFGEEAPLVGNQGSGTIFFAQCNLGCVFCQNWEISHGTFDSPAGTPVTPDQLAWIMLELQNQGALNINLVTPTHVVPQILQALDLAAAKGLELPLVYNCGGYEEPETLSLLDGVVDIYMPDVKFWDERHAERCLLAEDYPQKAGEAVKIMFQQVGDLVLDERGIAYKGLLVRHLVMPQGLAGTREWMQFLAGISPRTYVNIMGWYRPCGEARNHPELSRPVTGDEVEEAVQAAKDAGLIRLDEGEKQILAAVLKNL